MNMKWNAIMLMGIFGVGLGSTNASASDLSRFLEHSFVNIAIGPTPRYQNDNGGYAADYGYTPQYGVVPQYGGGYDPVAAPYVGGGNGSGISEPDWRGNPPCHQGDRHCHHNNGGGYREGTPVPQWRGEGHGQNQFGGYRPGF